MGQQSAALIRLLDAAGPGGFALPWCQACGHRFYPAQSWCPRCLAADIDYVKDDCIATVVSMTELHISFDPVWKTLLPLQIACVRTASGVSLFALADGPLPAGTAVRIGVREATDDLPALVEVRDA